MDKPISGVQYALTGAGSSIANGNTWAESRTSAPVHVEKSFAVDGDGYEWMGRMHRSGWRPLASWGKDGWDFGEWPYMAYLVARSGGRSMLASYCEGDVCVYTFASEDDRSAWIDREALAQWRREGADWLDRPAEDLRGPYRKS